MAQYIFLYTRWWNWFDW